MPQPAETESTEVGAGVEPGTAAAGSTAWAVHSAIGALKANREDPMRSADRRNLVRGFEIAEGKKICSDYILDCFTHAPPQNVPTMKQIGSVFWAVELLVREVLKSGDAPKRAAERRNKVLGFEVLQGRERNEAFVDFIADCFTELETSESEGFGRESIPRLNLDHLDQHLAPRMLRPRPAASLVISNQPSSTRADQADAFKVSLCCDSRLPEDKDIVLAQWRDGKSNYIVRTVAERQGLKEIDRDTVKGYVGIFSGRSSAHMARPVIFQVKPDDKKMGDVLLGTDFHSKVAELEQWETISTQGGVVPPHYPPASVSSQYSETDLRSTRPDDDDRAFYRETLMSVNKLVSKLVEAPTVQDSAYGSMASSSRSGQRSERGPS